MNEINKVDMDCFPYKRKKVYIILTIPIVLLILAIFIYLWTIYPLLSIVYISFYFLTWIFQSYCCAYQECPYINGFCPGVAGIVPASFIARIPLIKKARKSENLFNFSATMGSIFLFSLFIFPLIWLIQLNIVIAVIYISIILIYAFLFLSFICPVCAIRKTCPGGRASSALGEFFKNDK